MAERSARIEQYETVHYDANLNPLGIPASVRRAISENIVSIARYPDVYYSNLKKAICSYTDVSMDSIVMGNGSVDLIKLFAALIMPKKSMILVPGPSEFARVLTAYGSELVEFDLEEEKEFELDVPAFIAALDPSLDLVILSNPNNPTSKRITRDELKSIADACKEKDIFFIVDEMYVEFLDDFEDVTAVPLVKEYENMAVLRSVSKFFAVPGLRFAYAILSNQEYREIIDLTTTKNNIATLSAIAGTAMFRDRNYIEEGRSVIHTERSLVYLAMSTCRTIRLYKPQANFMLVRLLKEDLVAADVAEHCNRRGIIIRRCDDIKGLGEKYIRFAFMNPKQNDLMVNTILEIV